MEKHPLVIFVTKRHEYAVQGYGIAFRYLVKPLDESLFAAAMDAVVQELDSKHFTVEYEGATLSLETSDIYYLESHGHTENDAADDLTVSVKNIMNEAYCRDISVKTRSALEVKRRSGDFVGAFTIYGYVKVGDKHKSLEVDEYAANVVRDIFRKRLEGFSASHIADELNRLGILSPLAYKRNHGMPHAKGGYTDRKDCKWSATTIIRILQDETYTGTLVQGKQTTPHFKLKEREDKPSSEWIRVEGTHEAIIQKHDFDLVQRLRRIDTRTSPKSDKVYLFSGILICGCCGCRMTRKTNRYKDKEYHYYYCPTGKKNGCTSSVMLKESDLIECVQDSLN